MYKKTNVGSGEKVGSGPVLRAYEVTLQYGIVEKKTTRTFTRSVSDRTLFESVRSEIETLHTLVVKDDRHMHFALVVIVHDFKRTWRRRKSDNHLYLRLRFLTVADWLKRSDPPGKMWQVRKHGGRWL